MSPRTRFTALALGMIALAACSETPTAPDAIKAPKGPMFALNATSTSAAGITPTIVEASQSALCTSTGYAHGWKAVVNSQEDGYTGGTYNSPDGYLSVTVTVTYNTQGNPDTRGPSIAFTANRKVDGVVVHGGGGQNVNNYNYGPNGILTDSDVTTPINSSGGHANISNIAFCYNYRPDMSKTASTSYQRDWSWTLSKTVDNATALLQKDQEFTVNYTVTVGASSAESNFAVGGNITISNGSPEEMTIATVDDAIAGAVVTCPSAVPFTIAAGGFVTCSYTAALASKTNGTNVATATPSGSGFASNSASAPYSFGDPTTENNACVAVSDVSSTTLNAQPLSGPTPATLNANLCRNGQTFNYSLQVGQRSLCGEYVTSNTASLAGGSTASASATVTVNVTGCSNQTICDIDPTDPTCNEENPPACTLSQGYWKTHSTSGPARNSRWSTQNNQFLSTGKTWLEVWRTAPAGNAWYSVAHQYMGAMLNQSIGLAVPTADAAQAITDAEAFFALFSGSIPSKLTGPQKTEAARIAAILENWNAGPDTHCSEQATI
jgi:hypothetical protein